MTSKQGYIYKLTDGTCYYIGSTTREPRKRFWEHSSNKQITLPCYKYFNDNNWTNCNIEIIDTIQFNNRQELLLKENTYIRLDDVNCLNKRKAIETQQEFNIRHNISSKTKVVCNICGKSSTRAHLSRHKKQMHPDLP
jgi:predicted GIY-YIG superfamily endonuclease